MVPISSSASVRCAPAHRPSATPAGSWRPSASQQGERPSTVFRLFLFTEANRQIDPRTQPDKRTDQRELVDCFLLAATVRHLRLFQ